MATQVFSSASLIKELNWLGKNGEYEKALKIADKILHEHPTLEEVWQCKVVCLVNKGRFDDAFQCIKKNISTLDVSFEKAYCEYRLNRCEDALKTLNQAPDQSDLRIKELLGQILYRLENFSESFSIYREIMKNTQDEFEDEREANLSASLAAINMWTDEKVDDLELENKTYEMLYNSACILIGQKKYSGALELLKKAEKVCEESLDEDEVEFEVAFIKVQMGYVLQVMGKNDEALALYNQIIKFKSVDAQVMAVACNNIVTINKDQSMFDSKKKIKVATSTDLKHKISSKQKQLIAINQCLLHLYSGQGEQCLKSVAALQGSCTKASLVAACKFLRDKKPQQAMNYLKECIQKAENQAGSELLHYALAQLLLEQDKVDEACDVLKQLGDDYFSPGVVSTMVGLYEKQGNDQAASEVINEAVQWHLKNQSKSEDVNALMRAGANIQLNAGKPQLAANMLEELRKSNPGDLKLLAQLIVAYSRFDPKKAHQVSKQFPAAEEVLASVDVTSLENTNYYISKWSKKSNKPTSPHLKTDVVIKKKSKKKKKKLLPKNYDPSVGPDPERWLPLKERSTYRGRRRNRRKEIGKGTQGATTTAFPELNASESPMNSDIGSPKMDAVQPPRQQRPVGAANKAKNKKKNKGKWRL